MGTMKLPPELKTAIARILTIIEKVPDDTPFYVHFDEARSEESPVQLDFAPRNLEEYSKLRTLLGAPPVFFTEKVSDYEIRAGWLLVTIQTPEVR